MKIFTNKYLILFIVLSWVMLCGFECHWPGDGDDDFGNGGDLDETEILATRAYATVDTIDVTTMDVETDDGVILTCALPAAVVVLIVGDRVEITIIFESNESMWVITTTEFFQKI